MYILSQDRKRLMPMTELFITKALTGGKYVMYNNTSTLGTYPTEQLAMDELEKISKALQNHEEIYIMEPEFKDKK